MNWFWRSAPQSAENAARSQCGTRLATSARIKPVYIVIPVVLVVLFVFLPALCSRYFFGISRSRQLRTMANIKTLAAKI